MASDIQKWGDRIQRPPKRPSDYTWAKRTKGRGAKSAPAQPVAAEPETLSQKAKPLEEAVDSPEQRVDQIDALYARLLREQLERKYRRLSLMVMGLAWMLLFYSLVDSAIIDINALIDQALERSTSWLNNGRR